MSPVNSLWHSISRWKAQGPFWFTHSRLTLHYQTSSAGFFKNLVQYRVGLKQSNGSTIHVEWHLRHVSKISLLRIFFHALNMIADYRSRIITIRADLDDPRAVTHFLSLLSSLIRTCSLRWSLERTRFPLGELLKFDEPSRSCLIYGHWTFTASVCGNLPWRNVPHSKQSASHVYLRLEAQFLTTIQFPGRPTCRISFL